jgi:hypothetical protein
LITASCPGRNAGNLNDSCKTCKAEDIVRDPSRGKDVSKIPTDIVRDSIYLCIKKLR